MSVGHHQVQLEKLRCVMLKKNSEDGAALSNAKTKKSKKHTKTT